MSVFRLFADLAAKKAKLNQGGKFDDFPFNRDLILCKWSGIFPDFIMRLDQTRMHNPLLRGGEMLELKSAGSFTVSSFNSAVPSGKKRLADIENSRHKFAKFAASAGENPNALPVRDVYYLARGMRKSGDIKVCLVHGSFFETIEKEKLIKGAFSQVIDDAAPKDYFSGKERKKIVNVMGSQEIFAASRQVENSSVSLRFRVMTEVAKDANIMDAKKFGEIKKNTLNFVVPAHGESEAERKAEARRINAAAKTAGIPLQEAEKFFIKHPFNGYFWVLQIGL